MTPTKAIMILEAYIDKKHKEPGPLIHSITFGRALSTGDNVIMYQCSYIELDTSDPADNGRLVIRQHGKSIHQAIVKMAIALRPEVNGAWN